MNFKRTIRTMSFVVAALVGTALVNTGCSSGDAAPAADSRHNDVVRTITPDVNTGRIVISGNGADTYVTFDLGIDYTDASGNSVVPPPSRPPRFILDKGGEELSIVVQSMSSDVATISSAAPAFSQDVALSAASTIVLNGATSQQLAAFSDFVYLVQYGQSSGTTAPPPGPGGPTGPTGPTGPLPLNYSVDTSIHATAWTGKEIFNCITSALGLGAASWFGWAACSGCVASLIAEAPSGGTATIVAVPACIGCACYLGIGPVALLNVFQDCFQRKKAAAN